MGKTFGADRVKLRNPWISTAFSQSLSISLKTSSLLLFTATKSLFTNLLAIRIMAFLPQNFLKITINNGLPGEHNDFFISVSKNNQVQSGYDQPQQREIPSSLFSGEDSITDHKTVAAFDASNGPSQDFIFFSKKRSSSAPLGYRSKLHRTKYKPVFSSGFDNSKGFHKVGQIHVLSLPKPPSLNYFKPKNPIYVPNYEGINMNTFQSFHTYKSSVGKKSKDGGRPPTSSTKASTESTPNSKFIFPHLGLRANKPEKEQGRSHLAFNVKLSSPLHGSTERSSNLGHQRFNAGPFILDAHPENKEKSSCYEPNKKVFSQHKDMHSIQKEIPPQTRPSSFSAQDGFLFLNGGYEDAMKAGLLKPISQPDGIQMLSDSMKTDPTNFFSWPSELFSEPREADLNCIIWKNTKSSSQPRSQKSARSSVNAYIKSKNGSARATAFFSKTCYTPFQQKRLINGNGNLSSDDLLINPTPQYAKGVGQTVKR
ncbi:hypothetical protein AMECASPLE_026567 [Ameca splendens]|uniref:Uncharacterized protein n=1 Tax=Ameca splendens TaxID=208324 RepID=A0ABV1ADW6_9TELE